MYSRNADGASESRRAFLGRTAALSAASIVPIAGSATTASAGESDGSTATSADGSSGERPVRRSIASLRRHDPDDVLATFREGLRRMRALPESDPRNFRNVVGIHGSERGFEYCQHGNWAFLPWHRAYLHYFEEIVRELTGNEAFAVPYWNWIERPELPGEFRGDESDPLYDPTRTDLSTAAPDVVDAEAIARILDDPNFLRAIGGWAGPDPETDAAMHHGSGGFEQPAHDYVHVRVGGHMAGGASPTDASFWAHHSTMDRLWWEWNARGHPNPADPAFLETSFGGQLVDRHGEPVDSLTIEDTLAMPAEAYTYDRRLELGEPDGGDGAADGGSGSASRAGGGAAGQFDDAVDEAQTATADVDLRAIDRAVLAREQPLADGDEVTLATAQSASELRPLLSGDRPAQLLLAAREIDMPVGESLLARVSLDPPASAGEPAERDRLGTWLFFGAPPNYPDQDYLVDVGDALRRRYAAGDLPDDEPLRFALECTALRAGDAADASLTVGRIDLVAAQSVIDGEVAERPL